MHFDWFFCRTDAQMTSSLKTFSLCFCFGLFFNGGKFENLEDIIWDWANKVEEKSVLPRLWTNSKSMKKKNMFLCKNDLHKYSSSLSRASLNETQNVSLLHKTNRFHVAVRLFSNRSQMTSKCGKNKKVAHEAIAECVTDILTTFWRLLWQTHGNIESIERFHSRD